MTEGLHFAVVSASISADGKEIIHPTAFLIGSKINPQVFPGTILGEGSPGTYFHTLIDPADIVLIPGTFVSPWVGAQTEIAEGRMTVVPEEQRPSYDGCIGTLWSYRFAIVANTRTSASLIAQGIPGKPESLASIHWRDTNRVAGAGPDPPTGPRPGSPRSTPHPGGRAPYRNPGGGPAA